MTHTDIPARTDRRAIEVLRQLGRGPLLPASPAIRGILARLKACGYRFRKAPGGRVALASRPDVLTPEEVLSGLSTRRMGRPMHSFRRVPSTNDVAMELARHGAPEGTMVVSEVQTQGRGRRGRSWAGSPGKGLAFSVVLRPPIPADEASLLTLAAAVAVAEALESFGARPSIKWPNDVLLSGRKVSGILTEMQAEQDRMSHVVVGVGVNVNQGWRDFPAPLRSSATSLRLALGRVVPRVRFLQALLERLEETLGWVARREGNRVLAAWDRRARVSGRQLRVVQGERRFFAQALQVDGKGALWVRNDAGMNERLTSGDVETLRVSGRMGRRIRKKGRR
jgi:BirA family biotin operon repressor/biotin-[acetyl-CoA-carboxylase] ligase